MLKSLLRNRMRLHDTGIDPSEERAAPLAKTRMNLDAPLRLAAHGLIRGYQLSLSSVAGRHCRHLPTCSSFADEAIATHGLWAGGWMGLARICRCQPWGTSGFDPVPKHIPEQAHWALPWRYGRWRGPLICEPGEAEVASSKPRQR